MTLRSVVLAFALAATATPVLAQNLAADLIGEWEGSYRCGQGVTGLTLDFEQSGEQLSGIFRFYPTPQNPSVPEGSYQFTAEISGSSVHGRQMMWLRQPEGYIMVDFTGSLDTAGNTLAGTIDHESCQDFSVSRAGGARPLLQEPVPQSRQPGGVTRAGVGS